MLSPKYIFSTLCCAALIIVAAFVYTHQKAAPTQTNTGSNSTTTSSVNLGGGVVVPTSGEGVQVLPVENAKAVPPPVSDKIYIAPGTDPVVAADARVKIAEIIVELQKDNEQLRLWLQLGSYRKSVGDYTGSRDALEYVAAAAPSNYVALNNLADLYMNYIKDYPKAEKNYKKVIAIKPEFIDAYYNLYTMYHYVYKTNTTAAADILILGLKNNPGNTGLLALQERLTKGQ